MAVHCFYEGDFLSVETPRSLVAGVVSVREVPA